MGYHSVGNTGMIPTLWSSYWTSMGRVYRYGTNLSLFSDNCFTETQICVR